MKKYDEIKFKGLDWYVIDTNEDTIKLLLKDVITEKIAKYCVDDEWYRNGNCIRMSNNVKPPFVWEDSYIYKTVLPKFKEYLGIDCEVDLLSKEEIEELPDDIKKSNDWYWTKTPYEDDTWSYAFFVNDYGSLLNFNVSNSNPALRPVVSLKSEYLKSELGGDKNPFAERTLPSKLEIEETMNEIEIQLQDKINEIIKYLGEQDESNR